MPRNDVGVCFGLRPRNDDYGVMASAAKPSQASITSKLVVIAAVLPSMMLAEQYLS